MSYEGPKWEYKVQYLSIGLDKSVKLLTELGQEGWELVAIDPSSHGYFKRKLDPGIERV